MDKKSSARVALYSRKGFKNCVGADCKKYVGDYIEKHGNLNVIDFSENFNVYAAASKLYNRVKDIEKFNEEGVKKPTFIKEIAYVIDRHIPYYLYKTFEELHGREPKPLKNFAHMVFPKDKFPDSSALYIYKTNEDEIIRMIDASKHLENKEKNIENKPIIFPKCPRYVTDPDVNQEKNGQFKALTIKYSKEEILEMMEKYHYREDNFALIAGNHEYIEKYRPDILNDAQNIHRQDKRDPIVYGRSLVAGWLFEQIYMDKINNSGAGIKVYLSGDDKDRIVLTGKTKKSATNNADFTAEYGGYRAKVELSMSHTGLFVITNSANMRDRKRKHMYESNTILLAIETFLNPNYGRYRKLKPGVDYKSLYAVVYDRELEQCEDEKYNGGLGKNSEKIIIPREKWFTYQDFIKELQIAIIRMGEKI